MASDLSASRRTMIASVLLAMALIVTGCSEEQVAPAQDPASSALPSPAEPVAVAPAREAVAQEKPAGPALDAMSTARPSAKISVPVSVRYQFDTPVTAGQPTTLHLALVPRIAGTNLKFEVKPAEGLRIDAAPLTVEKATAAGVYRHALSLTTSAGAPQEAQVLVIMDTVEGRGFGLFSIPLSGQAPAAKRESVKQR